MWVIPIFKQLSHLVPLHDGWLLTPVKSVCLSLPFFWAWTCLTLRARIGFCFSAWFNCSLTDCFSVCPWAWNRVRTGFHSLPRPSSRSKPSHPVHVSESVQDYICPSFRVCTSLSFRPMSCFTTWTGFFSLFFLSFSSSLSLSLFSSGTSPPPSSPSERRQSCLPLLSLQPRYSPSPNCVLSLVGLSELTSSRDHLTPSSAAHSEPITV